jgi:hypothetical protein
MELRPNFNEGKVMDYKKALFFVQSITDFLSNYFFIFDGGVGLCTNI